MNKRKTLSILIVIFLISAFIVLFTNITKLSNENNLLKNRQGEVIQRNILFLKTDISFAQEDLYNKDVTISNLYGNYWRLNEFTMVDLPQIGIIGYLINIRNDFSQLIELREGNKLPQQEVDVVIVRLKSQLSKLQEALSLIKKECGNDSMKYYLLNSDGNETMKNVIKILVE